MSKIVYDPGHGGKDPGAIGHSDLMEKNVNLEVALRCSQYSQRLGHQVLLTRSQDTYVPLMDRVKAANTWSADAFVSIHCNAYSSPEARGTEVWTFNETDASREFASGMCLAFCIMRYLNVTTGMNYRGIKYKPQEAQEFTVLRQTVAPAALVEVAFITNQEEENLLREAWYLEKVSLGIIWGVEKYLEIPARWKGGEKT